MRTREILLIWLFGAFIGGVITAGVSDRIYAQLYSGQEISATENERYQQQMFRYQQREYQQKQNDLDSNRTIMRGLSPC